MMKQAQVHTSMKTHLTLFSIAQRGMLLLSLTALSCCGPHSVDQRRNDPVGESPEQSIVLENATGAKLVLMPRPGQPGAKPLTLAPGGKQELPFILTDEENQSPNREHELILNEAKSSPYLVQKDTDLQVLARFGAETSRDTIRIEVGRCVLADANRGKQYPLRLKERPEAGIPSLDLCPDD